MSILPPWDGELSDLDVETKELGLFDPLNLPAMPENERRTVESIWHEIQD